MKAVALPVQSLSLPLQNYSANSQFQHVAVQLDPSKFDKFQFSPNPTVADYAKYFKNSQSSAIANITLNKDDENIFQKYLQNRHSETF